MVLSLNEGEIAFLLSQARNILTQTITGDPAPCVDAGQIPPGVLEKHAVFVTLLYRGELRGCIGTLNPSLSILDGVRKFTVESACRDYRFSPVQTHELKDIQIEISVLTDPEPMEYGAPEELPDLLVPGKDGVVLDDGRRSAVFLPQVWESLPSINEFLGQLCMKMGARQDYWLKTKLKVSIFHVQKLHE